MCYIWIPPAVSGYPYQKGYIGSLMRSVGSPAAGPLVPQPNYQYKLPYKNSFQCPLMSNHEIYDIATELILLQ